MSKKYMLLILLLIPTVLITNEGCKKQDIPVYNVEQEVKDWFFFDTGTWWLYQEVNSGNTDSQYVIQSDLITTEYKGSTKKSQHYISQHAILQINNGTQFRLSSPKGGGMVRKTSSAGDAGSTCLFFKPLEVGNYPPGSSVKIMEINNDFQLDSKNNILLTLLDRKDDTEMNDSLEYKVFKGVGIINKKNISRKQEWKLIKYHINLNKK